MNRLRYFSNTKETSKVSVFQSSNIKFQEAAALVVQTWQPPSMKVFVSPELFSTTQLSMFCIFSFLLISQFYIIVCFFFVCMFFFFFSPYTNADKQIPLNRFLLLPICSSNSLWPWLLLSQSSLAFNSTLIVPEVKDKINKVYDCLVIKDKLSASYTTSSIYCWMISWFFIVPNKTWIQGLCSILLQGKIIKNWWLCRGLKIQSKGNSI